jgi:hypothetical protein
MHDFGARLKAASVTLPHQGAAALAAEMAQKLQHRCLNLELALIPRSLLT